MGAQSRDRGLSDLTGVRLPSGAAVRIWNRFLDHLKTLSAIDVAKLPGMPSATAFNARRATHPAFAARADEVVASRKLNNSGRARITQVQWGLVEQNLKLMPVMKAIAFDGAPSPAAIFVKRRTDPRFRALMDAAPNGRIGVSKPRRSKLITRRRPAVPTLTYPYILVPRAEHADILAINDLVPQCYPEAMRADICQEVALAVIDGRVTIDELRTQREKAAWFLRKFWRDNHEDGGRAVTFEAVDDERSYDEIAASLAAKEWHQSEINDRRNAFGAFATFNAPTQIEETFAGQVRRKWVAMQESALQSGDMRDMLSIQEVEALMEGKLAA